MLQYLLVIVLAYLAYHWLGWPAAAAVVVIFIALTIWHRYSVAAANKAAAVKIVGTPLSDAEKIQLETIADRNQRMAAREAAKKRFGSA